VLQDENGNQEHRHRYPDPALGGARRDGVGEDQQRIDQIQGRAGRQDAKRLRFAAVPPGHGNGHVGKLDNPAKA
jgi:hypothetical protein